VRFLTYLLHGKAPASNSRRFVDEVALAQVETESTIMIDVTLMPAQLVALRKHVDRTIEENLCKTDMEREELDAIQALRDAWRYRWSEPLL
jgi:hypothetical protein